MVGGSSTGRQHSGGEVGNSSLIETDRTIPIDDLLVQYRRRRFAPSIAALETAAVTVRCGGVGSGNDARPRWAARGARLGGGIRLGDELAGENLRGVRGKISMIFRTRSVAHPVKTIEFS